MKLSGRSKVLYPTRVHARYLSNSRDLNQQAKKLILRAAKAEPSANLSNVGGWQSKADWLMLTEARCLDELKNEFADAIMKALLSELSEAAVEHLDLRITGWANVNLQGNSNALH